MKTVTVIQALKSSFLVSVQAPMCLTGRYKHSQCVTGHVQSELLEGGLDHVPHTGADPDLDVGHQSLRQQLAHDHHLIAHHRLVIREFILCRAHARFHANSIKMPVLTINDGTNSTFII